jgi:transcriptional regulator
MYIPPLFTEHDPEALYRIMAEHPLGALITHGEHGLDAEHIPLLLNRDEGTHGVLSGHVARANSLWQRCPTGTPVLVIFHGAQGYISPNWYPSKHEAHRQVPTWNYEVVHAHGTLTIHDDERFVRGIVARLTKQHEANEPKPWKMGDSAPDFIRGMLEQIVGIEITITSLVGKRKLGQNREDRDRVGAIDTLASMGQHDLSTAMKGTMK